MSTSKAIAADILPAASNRKSIRAFSEQAVSEDTMKQLFEAARWSFSAANQQPWRFVYAHQNQPLFTKIWEALMDGNKPWTAKAAVLVAVFATKQMGNGKPYKFNLHDTGAATMSMALQAAHLGLQIHPMAGYHADALLNNLNVPDTLEPVTILAIGYPSDDVSHLTEAHQAAEKIRGERLEQSAFAFNQAF
jgi:nitroreductase